MHEHLGRGLRVRQRAVARSGRNAEEMGQRAEADAPHAALRAAGAPARAVQSGGSDKAPGRASAAAAAPGRRWSKRALCATRRLSPANGEETSDHRGSGNGACRSSCSRRPVRRAIGSGSGDARDHQRLEGLDRLERAHADGPRPRRCGCERAESPVVSRSKTTNSASSSVGSERPPTRETVVPVQTTRLSPAVTSSSSGPARPSEIERGGEQCAGGLDRSRAARAPRACPPAGRAHRGRAAREE